MHQVDLDQNGLITRVKFDAFGEYVIHQWEACEEKVKKKRGNNAQLGSTKGSFNLSFNLPQRGR